MTCFVISSFHYLYELGWTNSAKPMHMSRLEDARLVYCFLQIGVFLTLNESDLQHTLNSVVAVCDIAGMKISFSKTEVLYLSKNTVQYFQQVDRESLKQVENLSVLKSHSQVIKGKMNNWMFS